MTADIESLDKLGARPPNGTVVRKGGARDEDKSGMRPGT
jgi:hypothetical protein